MYNLGMSQTRSIPARPTTTPQSKLGESLGRILISGKIQNGRGTGFQKMRVFGVYALVYLLEGNGEYRDATGLRMTVSAGDVILVLPDLPHQYGPRRGESWKEIFIAFDGPLFHLWRESGFLDSSRPVWRLNPTALWLERFEFTMPKSGLLKSLGGLRELAQLQLLLAQALDAREEAGENSNAWQNTATLLLEPRDDRRTMPLPEVARNCGMSYETFRKKFPVACGMSPTQYRLLRKMEKAKTMLARGSFAMKEIAEALGFSDEFHFSKTFKRIVGINPRDFRALGVSPTNKVVKS